MRLARAEIAVKLSSKLQASVWMVAAGLLWLIAGLLVVQGLVFGIASFGLALHWSCLLVAAVIGTCGAIAYLTGRTKAQEELMPRKNNPPNQKRRFDCKGAAVVNQNPNWGGSPRAGDWLLGAVKRNPEELVLLAAGCALMMRSGSSSQRPRDGNERSVASRYDQPTGYRENASSPSGSVGASSGLEQGYSRAAKSARDYATEIKDRVAETASSYASSVADYAEDARRSVTEHSGRTAREVQSTVQRSISRVVREQPLAIAILGLAAGAAVAAILPASDIERETLGPAGEKISDAASKAREQLKEAAAKAGDRLMSAAEERGLNAEGLKEVAQDVAGAFGSAFSGGKKDAVGGSSGPHSSRSSTQANYTGGTGDIPDAAKSPSREAFGQSPGSVGSGAQMSPSPAGSGRSEQRDPFPVTSPGAGSFREEPGTSDKQKNRGT